jgi:hypothetical protein
MVSDIVADACTNARTDAAQFDISVSTAHIIKVITKFLQVHNQGFRAPLLPLAGHGSQISQSMK